MKIRAHESFYLRRGWLQKGIKNIKLNNRIFNDKDSNACDVLGIGTNMVKSLKYWLIASGIAEEVTEDKKKCLKITELGELIEKYDKYFEEIGTNLIIHYQIVKNEEDATAWHWFFNDYDETVISKQRFEQEFNSYLDYTYGKPSKVLDDEFNCIVKTYIATEKEDDPEENKVCPLAELGLLEFIDGRKEIRKTAPKLEDINPYIAFAFICDYAQGRRDISIEELCLNPNTIGKVFNLSRTLVIELLNKLSNKKLLTIERTAGLDMVHIDEPKSYLEALELYYKELNGEEI